MAEKRLTEGLDPTRLDQLVKDLGIRVRLFKSTVCPNMKSIESLDHDINCQICNHNMIDFDCKETVALFQQQSLQQPFMTQGTFSIDEVQATFLSSETLQHYARIELIDFAEDFFELIERQSSGATDRLKYPACSVLAVFVVRAGVKKRFYEGADFKIDVNGDIEWTNSLNKPAAPEIYSVYYKFHPVFRAVKAIHRDRYTQFNNRPQNIEGPKVTIEDRTYVKLSETWILKRDYLIERRGQDGALLPPDTFHDPNA